MRIGVWVAELMVGDQDTSILFYMIYDFGTQLISRAVDCVVTSSEALGYLINYIKTESNKPFLLGP
jgi:hypothetical protein